MSDDVIDSDINPEYVETGSLLETFQDTVTNLHRENSHISDYPNIGDFWDKLINTSIDNYHQVLEDFRYYQIPDTIKDILPKYPDVPGESQIKHDLEVFRCFHNRVSGHLQSNYKNLKQLELSILDKIKKKEGLIEHIQNLEKFQDVISSTVETQEFQSMIKKITDSIQNDNIIQELENYIGAVRVHRELIARLQELRVLQNKPLCPICFTDSIDITLIPCGHSLCHTCYQRIQDKNTEVQDSDDVQASIQPICMICRRDIDFHQKIYFS